MFSRRYTNFWDGLFRPSKMHLLGSGEVKTLTNLVTNGNFVDETGWTKINSPANISYSPDGRSAGAIKIISTTSPATAPMIDQAISMIATHKYYVSAWRFLESGNAGTSVIYLANNLGTAGYLTVPQSNSATGAWYRHSAIYTATTTRTEYLQFGRGSPALYTARFCDAIIIDLTAAFGAGNEPTQTEFESWINTQSNSWFDTTANYLANTNQWF